MIYGFHYDVIKLNVCGNCFTQVMPIGYAQLVKKQLYLTNPLAVDFGTYLQKLRQAQELYKRSAIN